MKGRRKLLAVALVLSFLITVIPSGVFAETTNFINVFIDNDEEVMAVRIEYDSVWLETASQGNHWRADDNKEFVSTGLGDVELTFCDGTVIIVPHDSLAIGTEGGGSVKVDIDALAVVNPDVEITKIANTSSCIVGDIITYTICVANTGDTNLTGLVVTDPLTELSHGPFDLGVAEMVSLDTTYTAMQTDMPCVVNEAMVSGYFLSTVISGAAIAYVDVTIPVTYTVTYEPGTQGTFPTQVTTGLNYGDPTPAAPVTTGNAGYTFTGWSPVPSATVTCDITYVAQWSQDEYTVRYEPGTQGTFMAQETTGLNYGDLTPAAPATPGNPGYTFTGWSPVPSATVTGDATYVAQWSDDTYTVRYEPGTQGTFTSQVTTGLSYGDPTPMAPATPGNPGYTFTGWSPEISATVMGDATYVAQWSQDEYTVRYEPGTQGTFAAQVTTGLNYGDPTPMAPVTTGNAGYTFTGWNPVLSATVTGDATYVAQWSQDDYTVRFEPGTQGTFAAQVTTGLSYGDPTPMAPTTTGNAGYTFTGWSPVLSATVTGDATYVAQWSEDTYTVRYEPGTQGTFAAQVTTGLNYGDTTPAAPATPGNPGYTFIGWSPVPSATVTSNATYVAQWSQDDYTVRYEPGTQGTFAAQVTTGLNYGDTTPAAPATPGNPGYTFIGWSPVPSATVTGNATYVAQWSHDEYTVIYEPGTQGTFMAQISTGLYYGDTTPMAPATPGNPGYTFIGWSPVPTETVMGDATYVAQWREDTYTVRYEPGTQGTFTAQVTTGLSYGDTTPAAPATPGNPGYAFMGWNPVPSTTVTGDATYVAQWMAYDYTVRYEPGTQGTFIVQETTGLNYGYTTPVAPPISGNPGYTFTGWSPVPTATVMGDATYVAQWIDDSYTVRYEPGTQGTFAAQVTTGLNYGDTTPAAPATPGNPGYTFTGWNPIPSATVTGDATYVAQWSDDTYTVRYEPGTQGTFAAQVTTGLLYGDTTPAAPATPGNAEYTFIGWSPVPSATVTGNATYVAQWRTSDYTVRYEPGTQGTFAAQVTTGLEYGDPTPTAPATPGNMGYTFAGWSPVPAATVTADATYVAQWSLVSTFGINVEKTVNDSSVTAGQTVVFTIQVTNTGNTSLTDITVVDTMLGVSRGYSFLAPGASESFSVSYLTTTGDIPGFNNLVVAEAIAMQEMPVSDTDSVSVAVSQIPAPLPIYSPSINVTITPDADLVDIDTDVVFTMIVTNTGNTVLNDVTITNTDLGFSTVIPTLFVLESETYAMLMTMTETGEFDFTVTAQGVSPQIRMVSDVDDTTVVVIQPAIIPAEPPIRPPVEPPIEIPDEPIPGDIPNPQTGAIPFSVYMVSGLMAMGAGVYGLIWKKKKYVEDGE